MILRPNFPGNRDERDASFRHAGGFTVVAVAREITHSAQPEVSVRKRDASRTPRTQTRTQNQIQALTLLHLNQRP